MFTRSKVHQITAILVVFMLWFAAIQPSHVSAQSRDSSQSLDRDDATWDDALSPQAASIQIDIKGPPGSGSFGSSVMVLPNGNFVVTDPYYDAPGPIVDVGAVYLYNGVTLALISTLTGSTADDRIGSDGVTVLTNGNYVVASPWWDNGYAGDAGAVTWGSETNGVSGVVSAANSLVGSEAGNQIGGSGYFDDGNYIYSGIVALMNGNYLVVSPKWAIGWPLTGAVGAVTWGSGTSGVSGEVSAANSLVGPTAGDRIGSGGVTELTNGNYVVASQFWDNGAAIDAGAVTWGSGMSGVSGVVSPANSLIGSTTNDRVGSLDGVIALTNGNYVVASPSWDNGAIVEAGAVTWGDGTSGMTGVVSAANSLVGSTTYDWVGYDGVTVLTNGNYVVASRMWDNGAAVDAGAVTWGSGAGGVSGVVSAANSLVGSTADDGVGHSVTALTNGNYVVASPSWDNGAIVDVGIVDVGAVTWGSGTSGVSGIVSPTNSLIGSTADDMVGISGNYYGGITALTNGNYVIASAHWDNGTIVDVGAVTWGDGMSGVSGIVSPANSLIGSTADDMVGRSGVFYGGITALTNGNYVVASAYWDNGTIVDVGAVTWGSGTSGVSGVVSAANSLIGSITGDMVGGGDNNKGVTPLTNGNYVVVSPLWDNGSIVDVGAVTWCSGTGGVSGVVSAANSLVGSTTRDLVGVGFYYFMHHNYYYSGVRALTNGNYVVASPYWDDGAIVDAGAVTWDSGTGSVSGVVSAANSLVGTTAYDQVGGGGYSYPTGGITALKNGNYVVSSPWWDNSPIANAGAVTFGKVGDIPVIGPVTTANSVLGATAGGGESINFAYDDVNAQLVVGRPADNTVTLFTVSTFVDILEAYWARQYIDRLYNAGITGGCYTSPLMYCPEELVTRGQMAVFLEKGLYYPDAFAPPNLEPTFNDTIGHWAEDWIEALKDDGITAGCGDGNYCPEDPVTRAQMAVFLLKAKHGASYIPPDVGSDTGFGDVPTDHWAAAWIKQLAAESITGGCGGGNYCPDTHVTRAQMAVFLVKTFNLP